MLRPCPTLLWVLLLLSINSLTVQAQVSEQDSLALVALYTATDGQNWANDTNWLTMPVSQWNGVTVTNNRVTKLNLFANQLTGPVPAELGDLTALTDLSLAFNQLTGTIPDDLGQLTSLTYLDLGGNAFIGTIPVELDALTNLTFLDFSNNTLSGTLPLGLISLSMLNTFWFNETALCTPIDEAFQTWLQGISDVRSTGCTNVAAEAADEIPSEFVLEATYPNPFNTSTTIRYALPEARFVRLVVYDGLGRRVQVLVERVQRSAWHEVVFEAGSLPSGVYFYRFEAGSFQASGQMLLTR